MHIPLKKVQKKVPLLSKSTYMVQDKIDRLAEIEARQMYLREQLRQAIDAAKIAIDLINQCDTDIYEMREQIHFEIIDN